MNYIKVFIKYLVLSITLMSLILCVVLAYLAFVPPKSFKPESRQFNDHSIYELEKKTGWYTLEDGTKLLITWGAYGGLIAVDFVNHEIQEWTPVSGDEFFWKKGEERVLINFTSSNKKGRRFTWIADDRSKQIAKMDSNQPYGQQEVTFYNNDVKLSGTLLIPNNSPVQNAAVFIHGSGVSDRNNYWYLYQANYLAQNNIMVLLPDKRGSGSSSGFWHTSSMQDFALDAIAGANYILNHYQEDVRSIGFVGFSQGGVIAPLAGSMYSETDFIVDVVGSTVTFNQQLKFEIYNDAVSKGVPEIFAKIITPAFVRRAKNRRPIWWKKNGSYSPLTYLQNTDVPSLIVFGLQDKNAPVKASLKNLQSIVNKNITIEVFEDSGHALKDPSTGWIRHDYLQMLMEWIQKR